MHADETEQSNKQRWPKDITSHCSGTQLTNTCSKATIETLEKGVKYVKS